MARGALRITVVTTTLEMSKFNEASLNAVAHWAICLCKCSQQHGIAAAHAMHP